MMIRYIFFAVIGFPLRMEQRVQFVQGQEVESMDYQRPDEQYHMTLVRYQYPELQDYQPRRLENDQRHGWSNWGQCTHSCGHGTQIRHKIGLQRPGDCTDSSCSGPSRETRSCNNHCCPVHCTWETWSDWSQCSNTCGGGDQTRSRRPLTAESCGGTPCFGASHDHRQCNNHCCPQHCLWASWSNWSKCSASCGGGQQRRSRTEAVNGTCGGTSCRGNNVEIRLCNNQCCPVNCDWESWTSWGDCSATCGRGSQSRNRAVRVLGSCGGVACSGKSLQSQPCTVRCCPVDCLWGPWLDWGSCSASCGGGFQNRSRQVVVPKFCGGAPCDGDATQQSHCNIHCCPVSCKWSDWSHWAGCSVTCGGGQRQRHRNIAIPSACNGERCVGPSSKVQTCNSQCCPIHCQWSDWGQWGGCSKSCGKGTQRRIRGIAIPSRCNGDKCPGNKFQDRFCNDICCPVHCTLSEWSTWTQCSKSCGNGKQLRRRDTAVQKTCGGRECVGDLIEARRCNGQCCPVDCSLSSWTEWSQCSHSCGVDGIRIRTRKINIPAYCGGASCGNTFSEEEACDRICYNGGDIQSDKCQCVEGFGGDCCENEVVVKCGNCTGRYQECKNTNDGYKCVCKDWLIMRNGTCEEKAPRLLKSPNEDTNDWISILRKPYMIAVLSLIGVVLIAISVLVTMAISRRSRKRKYIFSKEGKYGITGSPNGTEDVTL